MQTRELQSVQADSDDNTILVPDETDPREERSLSQSIGTGDSNHSDTQELEYTDAFAQSEPALQAQAQAQSLSLPTANHARITTRTGAISALLPLDEIRNDPLLRLASSSANISSTPPNTDETNRRISSRYDYDLRWDMVGRTDPAVPTPLWHDPIRPSPTPPFHLGRSPSTTSATSRRSYQYHRQSGDVEVSSNLSDASSSSTSSSSSSMRRRRVLRRHRPPPSGVPETIDEQQSGLRASLDAGMVRWRRWIRAHVSPSRRHSPPPPTRTPRTSDDMMMNAHATNFTPPHRQRTLSEPEGIQMRDLLNDPRYREEISFLPADHNEYEDPNREARTRWVRINRRFQLTITIVALIFSFLLCAILVCWVGMTASYVISIDKKCNVPLKTYFWLATLQLLLDVFRSDIMRGVFQWEIANSSTERIPLRVILYNVAYLIYALVVLRMGVGAVFLCRDTCTCQQTAPMLFKACTVFVSLSVAAWSTIILGYLVPFCFVATLLTWNGYTPNVNRDPRIIGPAAYSREGAPPGTMDLMRIVVTQEGECCICMGDFEHNDTIVATECDHVFHRHCCEEWLRQARTCPVCRTDIPSCYESQDTVPQTGARPVSGLPQEVVNLLRIWRPRNNTQAATAPEPTIARLPAVDVESGVQSHRSNRHLSSI